VVEGSLRNVPLGDVVQIVTGGQKSGVLTVASGETRARVYLERGRVQVAHLEPGTHLGEILVRMDALSTHEVQEILARQERENAGTPLGLMAVEAGLLERETLQRALRRQAVEVLAELLGWRDGTFSFAERSLAASQVPTSGSYDAMALLMEADALRRDLDAGTAAPSAVYRRVGDPTEHDLPAGAWELLPLLDGRRPARTVVADADLAEAEGLRLLRRLEEAGVIEELPREEPEPVVLVVSPSPALQRLIRLALQRVGLTPALFDAGEEALAAVDEVRPSVVVVDDRGGEGWELVRRLRATPGRGHLPALVLSDGDGAGGWWARWRRPRAEELRRPFHELELQERVARLAGRSAV
jgi:CheY-like chemotaxis protein